MTRYRTHCKRAHRLVDGNVWVGPGGAECRKCASFRGRKSYWKRKGWILSEDLDVRVEPGAIRFFPQVEP